MSIARDTIFNGALQGACTFGEACAPSGALQNATRPTCELGGQDRTCRHHVQRTVGLTGVTVTSRPSGVNEETFNQCLIIEM